MRANSAPRSRGRSATRFSTDRAAASRRSASCARNSAAPSSAASSTSRLEGASADRPGGRPGIAGSWRAGVRRYYLAGLRGRQGARSLRAATATVFASDDREAALRRAHVPAADADEVALVDGVEVVPVATLAGLVD